MEESAPTASLLDHKKRPIACISCRKSHVKCEWSSIGNPTTCNRCLKLNLKCTIAPKNTIKRNQTIHSSDTNSTSTTATTNNAILLNKENVFPNIPNLFNCTSLQECNTVIVEYQQQLQEKMKELVAIYAEKQSQITTALIQWQQQQQLQYSPAISSSTSSSPATTCCTFSEKSQQVVTSNCCTNSSSSNNEEMDLSQVQVCSCEEGGECKCNTNSSTLTLCTNFSNCISNPIV